MEEFVHLFCALIAGFIIGGLIGSTSVKDLYEKDCKIIHVIRINDKAYDCTERK